MYEETGPQVQRSKQTETFSSTAQTLFISSKPFAVQPFSKHKVLVLEKAFRIALAVYFLVAA